ncbi:MAG: hypothetical protein DWQ34_22480 [Planctomycetota bacterium]|nr:MAG: hypothetical protein DWQ34_22480 [Planctomycetota bacterium]REJ93948.1 MAG: hypothetical protein DWQ29_03370 [Planctomycetota bacterium]REK30680.1 MAG: hypothetical protein DWQ41_01665 [Planctomycetota bacterium]REK33055.1 MAG: hypothetical protein DWQ45_15770 [Planctomycetota bacterium]
MSTRLILLTTVITAAVTQSGAAQDPYVTVQPGLYQLQDPNILRGSSTFHWNPGLRVSSQYVSTQSGFFDRVNDHGVRVGIHAYLPLWNSQTGTDGLSLPFITDYCCARGSSWLVADGSSWWADVVEIGFVCGYSHTDYNPRDNVQLNVPGGNNYVIRDMNTNLFEAGLETRIIRPFPFDSINLAWYGDAGVLFLLGQATGDFAVQAFDPTKHQVLVSGNPRGASDETMYGGRVRLGTGLRGSWWSAGLVFNIDRFRTDVGTPGDSSPSTTFSTGAEVEFRLR